MQGKGGCLAPPFDGISKRRKREFLMARITADSKEEEKFHELYQVQELMPHVRIPRPQATKVVDYLLSLPKPEKGFKVVGHEKKSTSDSKKLSRLIVRLEYKDSKPKSNTSLETGKKLVYAKGCLACHSINNAGGRFGPSLDKIGQRRSLAQIADRILAAELLPKYAGDKPSAKPEKMPSSDLSIKEIESIATYLKSLK